MPSRFTDRKTAPEGERGSPDQNTQQLVFLPYRCIVSYLPIQWNLENYQMVNGMERVRTEYGAGGVRMGRKTAGG